jgi:hypothetical protein
MPQVPYDLGPFETQAEAQETCDQINRWGGVAAVVQRPDGFFVRVTQEPGDAAGDG